MISSILDIIDSSVMVRATIVVGIIGLFLMVGYMAFIKHG